MKSLIYSTKQIFKYVSIFSLLVFGVTSCSTTSPASLGNVYEDDGIYYNAKDEHIYRLQKKKIDSLERIVAMQKNQLNSNNTSAIGNLYFDEKGNGPEETYYNQEKQTTTHVNGSKIVIDDDTDYASSFGVNEGTDVNINVWGGFGWGWNHPYSRWGLGYNSWHGWNFGFGFGWGWSWNYPYSRWGWGSPWYGSYYGYRPWRWGYPHYGGYYGYHRVPYGSARKGSMRYNSALAYRTVNSDRVYSRGRTTTGRSYRSATSTARDRSYRTSEKRTTRQYRTTRGTTNTNRQYRNSGTRYRQYRSSGNNNSNNRQYRSSGSTNNRQYRNNSSNRSYRQPSSSSRSYTPRSSNRGFRSSGSTRSSGGSRGYRR